MAASCRRLVRSQHWIHLAVAVVFEIAVAICAGKAQGFTHRREGRSGPPSGALATYFLSQALLTFDVGVGYALWTSLAGVGITLIGVVGLQLPGWPEPMTRHDKDFTMQQTSAPADWATLVLAGAFEVGYALAVGGSEGFTQPTWSAVAVVFFLLTLWAPSRALRTIEVSIGYAVWAGIGAVGAALLGPVFFAETLTASKVGWLAAIIAGVVWLKLADRPGRA